MNGVGERRRASQEEIVLTVIFGLPVLAGLVFSTVVLTGLFVRRVPSSILTGVVGPGHRDIQSAPADRGRFLLG